MSGRVSKIFIISLIVFSSTIVAGPVLQMNRAFMALSDLVPFLGHKDEFMDKKNEKNIESKIVELQSAFKSAKHDKLLKGDLFAPSYELINENIENSLKAFRKNRKDYAHWRLKEITTHCMDCHTRLPPSLTSSFQNGEFSIDEKKFDNSYNLGLAQLIVRRYVDAKYSFNKAIQDRLITKDYREIILPFKQILVIDAKVMKNPSDLSTIFQQYVAKHDLPGDVRSSLQVWLKRLQHWKGKKELQGLHNDVEVENFINNELIPRKKKNMLSEGSDVDLLFSSGLLSNYLFENPTSKKAADISFWLGWAEKYLKRENFFGSGDLFLKQCIRRYPTSPIAKECLKEYRESVEFDFSGSAGTDIPEDISKEIRELEMLIKRN